MCQHHSETGQSRSPRITAGKALWGVFRNQCLASL